MTTYRISAPVTTFTGDVGNCHFVNGVYEGAVEDGPLAYFTGQGYSVEEIKPTKATAKAKADATPTDAPAASAAATTNGASQ